LEGIRANGTLRSAPIKEQNLTDENKCQSNEEKSL
jgi:hypothetical protein